MARATNIILGAAYVGIGLGGLALGLWRIAHGEGPHGALNAVVGVLVAMVGVANIREGA